MDIPFLSEPSQRALPSSVSMIQKETAIVDQEIQGALRKVAIRLVQPNTKNQSLSSIFIVLKKDSGHHHVINLKKLNKHIPYIHSLYPDNLKDAYFSAQLNSKSPKFVSFK